MSDAAVNSASTEPTDPVEEKKTAETVELVSPVSAEGPATQPLEKPAVENISESASDTVTYVTSDPAPIIQTTQVEPLATAAPAPTESVPTENTATASTTTDEPAKINSQWGEISQPLSKFHTRLPDLLKAAEYNEVFGIALDGSNPPVFSTLLILQKFLRANQNDIDKAYTQLEKTLKWRKSFQPLDTLKISHDKTRFSGLGYIQLLDIKTGEGEEKKKEVVTWNIYGSVKDFKKTFEDLDGFLKWRVALMETGISHLNLSSATAPIPDLGKGADPYQLIQVHDYMNVSFLRMDPYAKKASNTTIEIFRDYYPEMLSRKFFVNVPAIMGWMFAAVKLFLSKETIRKFMVLSYGTELAKELGDEIPKSYGGKGPELSEGAETVRTG